MGGDVTVILTSAGAIVTYIATIVGVIVSVITYIYNQKRFRRDSLAEAFRLLNGKEHREARKVVYGESTPSSYEILGIKGPAGQLDTASPELMILARNIVRSDFNELGTLVHYDLLDG